MGKTAARQTARKVDGEDFLYRFFERMLSMDQDFAESFLDLVVTTTAVWMPPDLYARMPTLAPWVVRDNSSRPRTKNGRRTKDYWGSPDERGYARDDNSLVKSIPRSSVVSGPAESKLNGARLGSGWVASHIWQTVNGSVRANRDPRLNSFIPNLVWLPSQIAKLSDREGEPVQEALKRASWGLFRNRGVHPSLREWVDDAWTMIPEPQGWKPLPVEHVHVFANGVGILDSRLRALRQVVGLLELVATGQRLRTKGNRIPTRYQQGIHKVDDRAIKRLHRELKSYMEAIESVA